MGDWYFKYEEETIEIYQYSFARMRLFTLPKGSAIYNSIGNCFILFLMGFCEMNNKNQKLYV